MAQPGGLATPALDAIHANIRDYYAEKAQRFGATPLGVDWTCAPTQELRFVQLLKIIAPAPAISVNDIGCGYGALAGFMHSRMRGTAIDYLGIDLAPEMISLARKRNRRRAVRFEEGAAATRTADYSLASGIFNVRLSHSQEDWHDTVARTLSEMAETSRLGFAVNFLAPAPAGPVELYRTPAQVWIDHCRERLGLRPQVLEGYGLREFTLLVPTTPP